MLLSLITIPLISQLMVWLFKSNRLKKHQDIFMCVVNIPDDEDQVRSRCCSSSTDTFTFKTHLKSNSCFTL